MKKITTILLAVWIALISVFFASCNSGEYHNHIYDTQWSYNNLYHWHDCSNENCNRVSGKEQHAYSDWSAVDKMLHTKVCFCGSQIFEPHNWDKGEIIKVATPETNGITKFVCTICSQVKNEAVEYIIDTTVTEEEWLKALSKDAFLSNGILNLTVIDTASYYEEQVHLFADGKKKTGETVSNDYDVDDFVNSDFGVFFEFRDYYSRFDYDEETDSYKFALNWDDINMCMSFQFINNRLHSYRLYSNFSGTEQWTNYVYTNIGSTVIQ